MCRVCTRLGYTLCAAVVLAACGAPGPTRVEPPPKPKIQVAAEQVDPASRAQYARALVLLRQGKEAEAEAVLSRLIAEHPDLPGPYFNLALLMQRRARHQEALDLLDRGIERSRGSAVAYNAKGYSLKSLGRFLDAEKAYLQALAINPENANTHLNIGILYELYLQELRRALGHYERYQELAEQPDEQVNGWIADIKRRLR